MLPPLSAYHNRWIDAPATIDLAAIPPDLLTLVGGSVIAAQALIRRGLTTLPQARAFVDPAFYTPTPAADLPDLIAGVDLLLAASRNGESLLIWGDFDADGQTSTALLSEALRELFPAGRLHWYIPDRLREGHGIDPAALLEMLDRLPVTALLTCDTGVTAHEAIDAARVRGLLTIITDHHALPETLPAADAVINPQRLPIGHPLRALPGVGTAYKFVEALCERGGLSADPRQWLDLTALGIVADVAALVDDTRYLLQSGLAELRHTQRPGIRALFDTARLDASTLTAEQIGFQIGPRLNAAGRLGDPKRAVELLTTRDPQRAAIIAQELEGLNRQRRQLQRDTEASARKLIDADPALLDNAVLVLYRADWQAGILGPVAGRLAERYQRPTILLTAVEPQSATGIEALARGSGRSAAGLDLTAALSELSALLTRFGGHPGAAGITLPVASISAFRRSLNETFTRQSADHETQGTLTIDALLPLSQVNPATASAIARLAPFGEGNPPVVLQASAVIVSSHAFIDRAHSHRRLSLRGTDDAHGHSVPVYWWNSGDEAVPDAEIDLAYTLDSAPDGTLQITLLDYRLSAAPHRPALPAREWIDCRAETAPRAALDRLMATVPGLTIWAEGYSQRESPGVGRHGLTVGAPLAIFTTPPNAALLAETISRLNPPVVYSFAVDPPLDSTHAAAFMRQLDSLVRLVISRQDGLIDSGALLTRLAQPEAVIRYALDHLRAIDHTWAGDQCHFSLKTADAAAADGADWQTALTAMLDETRAYRAYFRRAPIATLAL